MSFISRRQFLASSAVAGAAVMIQPWFRMEVSASTTTESLKLNIAKRMIEVKGRPADVFGLTQADGSSGLIMEAGKRFQVELLNNAGDDTLIHWHGLTPPWQQDGVPGVSQELLPPNASYHYDFLLERAGTNWMHAHHKLQEQQLMAAPLIIRDPAEAQADIHEIVVIFHDFTFRNPEEILIGLQQGGHGGMGGHGAMSGPMMQGGMMHSEADHSMMGHGIAAPEALSGMMNGGMMHLNDVQYDAFLANDRTLEDPEIHSVERGGRVRLRLINGAAATNFWIDLGALEGKLIAVDGMPVQPIVARRFEFAIAQRLDILLTVPNEDGAWPILARQEGEAAQTGVILRTKGARIEKISSSYSEIEAAVGLDLEHQLRATSSLPSRPATRHFEMTLGELPNYVWLLNGARHGEHMPLRVQEGDRVEITYTNATSMAHPMHLHGHHVQVVAINNIRLPGAVRDTILIPRKGRVTVAFDANNPGKWALHCHHLYHMAGGMMTTLEYEGI